jgi:Protein of unknown function (DUF3052)
VSATAGPPEQTAAVGVRMGLTPKSVVQELGWDTDVDDDLRIAIEDAIDSELIEDAVEAVDMVVLWWRDDDGDLVDGLVEAMTDLAAHGQIWLFTPKIGRSGYIDAADIAEAAVTAGLSLTNGAAISTDWAANKLVRPKSSRR